MDTTRQHFGRRFWGWIGTAFIAGLIVGVVLGVCAIVILAQVLTVMISPVQ